MTLDPTNNPWESVTSENPPPEDKMVEVKDDLGNVGRAYATYYPFKVKKDPENPGKWGSKVEKCNSHWDGGWLIQHQGLECPIKGTIVAWKEV
jgi:hypothetical protein